MSPSQQQHSPRPNPPPGAAPPRATDDSSNGDADNGSIVAWLGWHLDAQKTLPSWSALKAEVLERYPDCAFETSGIKERCRNLLRAKCDAMDAEASAQLKAGVNPAALFGGKPATAGRLIGQGDRVLESGCWIEPALQRAVAERDGLRARAGTGVSVATTATRVERVMESGCWIEIEVEA